MWVWPLGREDPLEQEKETHSSIIAWRIPWREEPGGLQSIGSQRVGHDWSNIVGIHTHMHIHNICMGFSDGSVKNPPAMQETSELIFQLGRSPGGGHGNPFQYSCLENPHRQRNLVGYGPFCRKELDITDQLSTHNIYICIHNVSSVQSDSLRSHESQHVRPPCPSPTPGVQTQVHRVGDAIQPSHPLWSPSPSAPNPFQYQGLSQWVNSSHEAAKVLEFQLQHQSFQRTPRTDLL